MILFEWLMEKYEQSPFAGGGLVFTSAMVVVIPLLILMFLSGFQGHDNMNGDWVYTALDVEGQVDEPVPGHPSRK